jgi:hypothetical protein
MTPESQEYRRRQAEKDAKYRGKFLERWFAWWRNPPDRFAALIAIFTAGLFAATYGLWDATKDLVRDAQMSGRAWLGPNDATIQSPMTLSQPIRAIIGFVNTGKEPAFANTSIFAKTYSPDDWKSGAAADDITKFQEGCMKLRE